MSKKTNKKYYVKNNRTEKIQKDKKTALKLLISFVVLFSLYFGMLRAGLYVIQTVYIWSAFVIALIYVFLCVKIASSREKSEKDTEKKTFTASHSLLKNLLIILVPIIFALLADYMLIILGFADNFGI